MNRWWLLGLGWMVIGCGGSGDAEGVTDDEGALAIEEPSAPRVMSGTYGPLELVAHDGLVSGRLHGAIGDPSRGGATCTFTFQGDLVEGRRHLPIRAVDGFESVSGVLVLHGEASVGIHLARAPGACDRVYGAGQLADPDGLVLRRTGAAPAVREALAFDTVAADKASFYADPNGTPRAAYVVRGDPVAIVEWIPRSEYVRATFKPASGASTTGFLKMSDLSSLGAMGASR